MVPSTVAAQPQVAMTAAVAWASTIAVAQGAAVEARLKFAARTSGIAAGSGVEAVVTVRDLSEEESGKNITVAESLAVRGFATLRPALGDNYFDQEEFKSRLQNGDPSAAASLLAEHLSSQDSSPEFGWVTCGMPVETRSQPGSAKLIVQLPSSRHEQNNESATCSETAAGMTEMPAILHALLLRLPSLARLIKVWLPLRALVQPLAMLDARTFDPIVESSRLAAVGGLSPPVLHKPGQRWWWHSNLGIGDAIVLDALRCPHGLFTVPGESKLERTLEAVEKLRKTLPNSKFGPGGHPPSFEVAQKVCNDLEPTVLEPFPFPIVGERYSVLVEPSALVRKVESVESDVIGELRPGGVVTILAVGQEGPGRAKVYTEHAVMAMEGYEDGGELQGVKFGSRASSMTGWISGENYNGQRLLQPLSAAPTGESPPAALTSYLNDVGNTLQGICSWVNITVGAAAEATSPSAGVSWHSAQISERHERTLAGLLEDAQHHSFQVQCLAVALPRHGVQAVVAVVGTVLAVIFGTWFVCPCC
mmetsp:Transcript_15450/g.26532  ORF Transcript_15450/g.26532 Transcript_15450/m.26532 type:complete len:534 (+) Transcript_15450:86-1687(+)